jgi:hypothetical protein
MTAQRAPGEGKKPEGGRGLTMEIPTIPQGEFDRLFKSDMVVYVGDLVEMVTGRTAVINRRNRRMSGKSPEEVAEIYRETGTLRRRGHGLWIVRHEQRAAPKMTCPYCMQVVDKVVRPRNLCVDCHEAEETRRSALTPDADATT